MRQYFYLLLLPLAFLYSCGNNTQVVNNDSTKNKPVDSFREGVLKLQRNGFLDKFKGKNMDSIIAVYRKDSINGMKQLLIDAGSMLHIDIGVDSNQVHGSRAPHDVYQVIVDSLSNRYADLKPSEIKHQYLPDMPGGKDTGWVLLSEKFGESWYTRKLYYFRDWPVDNFIYRLYNTMLADSGSDTRLYLTQFFLDRPDTGFYDDFMDNLDVTRMGVMRLTKTQADTIMSIPQLETEPENEFSVYTTKEVEQAIDQFRLTGLITSYNQKWYNDTVCQEIRWNSIYKKEDFLDFVDRLFCRPMDFDTVNIFNPYEEILMTMQDGSRGYFNPDGMNDQSVGQSNVRTVRFSLKGKIYEKEFTTKNGIVSPFIVTMVNDALEEQHVDGAFYSVMTRDKVALMIFLKNSEVDQVMKSGFFDAVEKGPPSELQIIYGAEPQAF